MAKYMLINTLSLPHPQNKKRTVLHRGGTVVDLDSEVAERGLKLGAVRELTDEEREQYADDTDETTEARVPALPGDGIVPPGPTPGPAGTSPVSDPDDATARGEVTLPERPSNGASTETWRAYLTELSAATEEELGSPIEVPANAKRDDMIVIGDARLAEWNEED